VQRKALLESELQRLLAELRPKHPDVQAKQIELDSVKKEMDGMVAEWKERIKEKEEKLAKRPDLLAADLETQAKLTEARSNASRTCWLGTRDRFPNLCSDSTACPVRRWRSVLWNGVCHQEGQLRSAPGPTKPHLARRRR